MPKPVTAIALIALWVAAGVGGCVASVGAANFLLREGGPRLLAAGVATAFAGLATTVGAVGLLVGRIARVQDRAFWLDLAAAGSVLAGVLGARAGLHAIERVAPFDGGAALLVAAAMVLPLLPLVVFFVCAAHAVFGRR